MSIQELVRTVVLLACLASALAPSDSQAADKFQRLTGPQIRAKLTGMQVTDEVHWRDVYERDGTLRSESMGRKTVGKWRIEKNELCLEVAPPDGGCFEVWLSDKSVQLRPSGLGPSLEGVIETPTDRR
jgi:hypothetical protein